MKKINKILLFVSLFCLINMATAKITPIERYTGVIGATFINVFASKNRDFYETWERYKTIFLAYAPKADSTKLLLWSDIIEDLVSYDKSFETNLTTSHSIYIRDVSISDLGQIFELWGLSCRNMFTEARIRIVVVPEALESLTYFLTYDIFDGWAPEREYSAEILLLYVPFGDSLKIIATDDANKILADTIIDFRGGKKWTYKEVIEIVRKKGIFIEFSGKSLTFKTSEEARTEKKNPTTGQP